MYIESIVSAAVTVLAIGGFFMLRAWIQKQADRSDKMRIVMICMTLIPAICLILLGVGMFLVETYSAPAP